MRYLSVCSGIEAASVAWHHLGWTPVGFSEIEPFPAAVLKHRFPEVPNYGDMTQHGSWPIQPGDIDLLVGGTPCQSFSVAGLRKGLEDPRGNLMLTYLAIAARLQPRWIVWENVPGVLSSNGGRDFGTFLGALGELGYGFAYRVLDAQYVRVGGWPRAVPQRRRRVFVVGCLGDGTAAAEVLALREGLQRHIEASGKARKGVAADAEGGARGGCWWDGSDCAGTLTKQNANGAQRMPDKDNFGAVLQPIGATDVSDSLVARNNQTTGFHTDVVATPTAYRWQNDRDGLQQDDAVAALRASAGSSGFHEMNHPVVVAHAFYSTGGTHGVNQHPEVSPAVKVGSGLGIPSPPAVAQAMTVRRLTARECERLQAFPDDYTLIPWRKKQAEDCPDGPRYKALGNSMACHCMAWIGERIAKWEAGNK
jgi:DNA (cytosine-5)-methyltransferase 1